MRTFIDLMLIVFALLLVDNAAHAGKFQTIDINKGNQKERSKDYFAIETAKGGNGCIFFTVHVKANPEDKQVRSSLARLEIVEGDKRVAWIPIDRLAKSDGSGHTITFELSRELAAKCTLVLVQLTMEAGGNVYRVNLGSYMKGQGKEGVKKP